MCRNFPLDRGGRKGRNRGAFNSAPGGEAMRHSKTTTAIAAAVFCSLLAGAAFAQSCPTPPAPPPESSRPERPGDPPVKPACIDARGGTARCKKGEIDRSNAEIDAFNEKIQTFNDASHAYVQNLNSWVSSVQDYASCELDIVNGKPRRPGNGQ